MSATFANAGPKIAMENSFSWDFVVIEAERLAILLCGQDLSPPLHCWKYRSETNGQKHLNQRNRQNQRFEVQIASQPRYLSDIHQFLHLKPRRAGQWFGSSEKWLVLQMDIGGVGTVGIRVLPYIIH